MASDFQVSNQPLIKEIPKQDRPREKLERLGAAALSDEELLAIFFRTGIRGKSAIELGRDLVKRYGSLNGLSRAGVAELVRSTKGIGPAKAAELMAVFEMGRRAAWEKIGETQIDHPEKIYELLAPEMHALSRESLRILLLNTRYHLIKIEEVSLGSINESVAHPREIFRSAIVHSAYAFALVHNHPSGDPSPSDADTRLTRRIREASQLMQIEFIDHVIIGRRSEGQDPYFSFREAGILA